MMKSKKTKSYSGLVVAIDIGNTNTDIALVDRETLAVLACKTVSSQHVELILPKVIRTLLQKQRIAEIPAINGASVIRSLMSKVDKVLVRNGLNPVSWLSWNARMPIKLAYKTPDTLGLDRIANAIYGQHAAKGKNVILIDSGTAITIDYLKAGKTFIGGVIMPGVSMQFECLNQKTAELPRVDLLKEQHVFPGVSTKSCILAGVLDGIAGGMSHIVSKIKNEASVPCIVYATGGAWGLTEKFVDFRYKYVPDMTILGVALMR